MKEIKLTVYNDGSVKTNLDMKSFANENLATSLIVDYSYVNYSSWTKQVDFILPDGRTLYKVAEGDIITLELAAELMQPGYLQIQAAATQLVGDITYKTKWKIVSLFIEDSLNVLENTVAPEFPVIEYLQSQINALADITSTHTHDDVYYQQPVLNDIISGIYNTMGQQVSTLNDSVANGDSAIWDYLGEEIGGLYEHVQTTTNGAVAQANDYTDSLLGGKVDKETVVENTVLTEIQVSLSDNTEYVYSNGSITSLEVELAIGKPTGFIASLVFVSSSTPPSLTVLNTGLYNIKVLGDGVWNGLVFTPTANKTVTVIFNYNGIDMNIYVSEA